MEMLPYSVFVHTPFIFCSYLTQYRPRKFSFDPKQKKLFSCSEVSPSGSPSQKFYHDGKLVSNDELNSDQSDWVSSQQPTLLSFLKRELVSDIDDEDESMTEISENTQRYIKSDEEMAYSGQCDPKMGPIFKIFQLDY